MAGLILRWALFSAALLEAGTAVYVDLIHPERLGRGRQRLEFLAIGVASLLLALGALYQLPLGWFGKLLAGAWTRRKLKRLFSWRHRVTVHAFASSAKIGKDEGSDVPSQTN